MSIIYAGVVQGVVVVVWCPVYHAAGGVQPWLHFYKALVPGAPAHTGVGKGVNHQVMWRLLWCIVQRTWKWKAQRPRPLQSPRTLKNTYPHLAHDRKLTHVSSLTVTVKCKTGYLCVLDLLIIGHCFCCSSLSCIGCIQPGWCVYLGNASWGSASTS